MRRASTSLVPTEKVKDLMSGRGRKMMPRIGGGGVDG